MRLIPIAVDILIVSTLLAAILRAGNLGEILLLDLRIERIPNFILRWLVVQMVFLGNSVLDAGISFVSQYPEYFKDNDNKISPANNENESDTIKSTIASAANALSGIASALGIGGASAQVAAAGKDDRRLSTSGLQSNVDRKRNSSHGNCSLLIVCDNLSQTIFEYLDRRS
ncbi:hypothetical protein HK100_000174 [Physocladia obscura]|uniref:Uncharacterized protein n=1 Tax=Physocladia obscura TaxID=109957 RepID=A0AAD5SZQ0_9FUNG|nr:hypothetical protein HK100_000174 [Physocladia obscura]